MRDRAPLFAACLLVWCTVSLALNAPRRPLFDAFSPEAAAMGLTDPAKYVRLTLGQDVQEPFRYRALVPAIAGIGLENSDTSVHRRAAAQRLVAVGGIFLVLTCAALFTLCLALEMRPEDGLLATLLFLTTRPVVQFAGIPMIDPASWFFLAAGLTALLKRNALALGLLFALGLFVKETELLIIPLLALADMPLREKLRLGLAVVPGLVLYLAWRFLWLPPGIPRIWAIWGPPTDWGGTLRYALFTLRPRRLADLGLSFGLLWIPALYAWYIGLGNRTLRRWTVLVPTLLVLILLLRMNLGRVLLLAFPCVIPYAVLGIRSWFARGGSSSLTATP